MLKETGQEMYERISAENKVRAPKTTLVRSSGS
jgi:hypothetical protein